MFLTRHLVRFIAVLVIPALLFSCVSYAPFPVSKDPPPAIKGRIVKLIPYGREDSNIMLIGPSIVEGHLKGTLDVCHDGFTPRPSQLANVYLDRSITLPDTLKSNFSIPMKGITKIEVYGIDLGKLVFTSVIALGITVVSAYAIFLFFILLTSCPFIYCFNGSEYEFTGEVFSGAILPSLERDDYLPLPNLKPVDGLYQLKIANQAKEIQYTNLAELCVVDHPLGTTVLADKHGVYHTLHDLKSPLEARSDKQKDVLPLISMKDDHIFLGDATPEVLNETDRLYLNFARPTGVDEGKLVLRAKNSIWLDYAFKKFIDLYGVGYEAFYQLQKKQPEVAKNWPASQNIPLSVYVKQNGAWRFIDRFDIIGPMAKRDVVMPIDLTGFEGNTLEMKIESGGMFWEIDYVAMDFSAPADLTCNTISLTSALDSEGKDVTRLLSGNDKKYYAQPEIGDEAVCTFNVPEPRDGWERSVFLHGRGHYKILSDTKVIPDLAYLQTFRQPGVFGSFTHEKLMELKALMGF
jgi:hypothetical protein